ncbi:MAG: hypothetical protein L0G72_03835, partial [Brevibacterium aurantiacum]|nr:hypothetical protein [Brevibacterium aurantiacum]
EARTSTTEKRSFWRANLEDGTKFEAAAEPKDEGRTMLVLTASKLPSTEALEERRAALKELLGQL